MRKHISLLAACAAIAGVAFAAQMGTATDLYLLDVDPARYSGPEGQRFYVQLDDEPRLVALGQQDEICVQLQRADDDARSIRARVSSLRPERHGLAVVKVAGPDVAPGTYRSTPWGLLLRVIPGSDGVDDQVPSATDAPVCAH